MAKLAKRYATVRPESRIAGNESGEFDRVGQLRSAGQRANFGPECREVSRVSMCLGNECELRGIVFACPGRL